MVISSHTNLSLIIFPSFESATAKVSFSQWERKNLRRPLLALLSINKDVASKASDVLSNLENAFNLTTYWHEIHGKLHSSFQNWSTHNNEKISAYRQRNRTCLAASAVENCCHKSCIKMFHIKEQSDQSLNSKKIGKVNRIHSYFILNYHQIYWKSKQAQSYEPAICIVPNLSKHACPSFFEKAIKCERRYEREDKQVSFQGCQNWCINKKIQLSNASYSLAIFEYSRNLNSNPRTSFNT